VLSLALIGPGARPPAYLPAPSCPVCRYGRKPAAAEESHSECAECGARDNLWMCLICGHVGCSRYGAGHAAKHFKESHHPFAMEVETQRVWDYVGDG